MMKAILLDIGSQLRLCAALMSDPELLRDQAHVVASQFKVAASRIEQLKAFLEKPAKAVSPDKPWFDKTVLDGVYKLVDVTLRKHLRPLMRDYKFPIVFQQELEEWNGDANEHLLIKEIKETNCLGALIVLYYLLYWHVALILLNRKHHPACYADVVQGDVDGDDDDDAFDFDKLLLSKLPKSHELFEHRRFSTGMLEVIGKEKSTGTVNKTGMTNQNLFDTVGMPSDSSVHKRCTPAVYVMREVILDQFDFDKKTVEISKKIHGLLGLCIADKLDLFAGVISTFDLQDDAEKWEDMYKLFHVQSNMEDSPGFAQYAYRLVQVLKEPPYSNSEDAFKAVAKRAAVYDYGSVALMTDISKSLIALARLVKALLEGATDDDVHSAIAGLMTQVYERNDKHVRDALKAQHIARKDETPYHRSKFIQHTNGWRRAECTLDSGLNVEVGGGSIVIDDIAGHYWGARPCDLDQFNHQYLACPSMEIDPRTGANMLSRFQAISNVKGDTPRSLYALTILTPLHRNSLFILSVCKTLTKVVDTLRPFLNGTRIALDLAGVLRPNPQEDATWVQAAPKPGIFGTAIDLSRLPKAEAPKAQPPITIAELQKRLNRETAALKYCIEQAKSPHFQKYPGISWPVVYGNYANFHVFERVHAIPKVTPSITESTAGVHEILQQMLTRAPYLSSDEHIRIIRDAAAKSIKTSAGGGGGADGGGADGGARRRPASADAPGKSAGAGASARP